MTEKEIKEEMEKCKNDLVYFMETYCLINKQSECDKVLKEIHLEWGENWDLVIDFFGQELADKIDKAVGYIK
jgi:hypothetical protein